MCLRNNQNKETIPDSDLDSDLDSESSIYSIDVVNEYLEGFEEQGDKISFDKFKKVYDGDTISEDGYKKVHEEFTKEDYLKFLNIKFDKYECCGYEENAAEELYKILLFIYDQLDMSQEEFNKILEDMLIGYLKRGEFYEFSFNLFKQFYSQSKFNFDINKFVIPTLEGLVISLNKCHGENYKYFKYSCKEIINYLGIHGANFETDEVISIINKFDTEDYYYPQIIKNPIRKYTILYKPCEMLCCKNK